MLVIDLDPLCCTLASLPARILKTLPSLGIEIGGKWLVGDAATGYWYQRDGTRWHRLLEDTNDPAVVAGLETLLRTVLSADERSDVLAIFPGPADLEPLASVGRGPGRNLTGGWTAATFWCAALGLPPGSYAIIQGGFRCARCRVGNWDTKRFDERSVTPLSAWGRDVWQSALEPVAARELLDATGLDPLADPVLARRFYSALAQACSQTSPASCSIAWEGSMLPLPESEVERALQAICSSAMAELNTTLSAMEQSVDALVMLPSARSVIPAQAWLEPTLADLPIQECSLEDMDAAAVARIGAVVTRDLPRHVHNLPSRLRRRSSRAVKITAAAGIGLMLVLATIGLRELLRGPQERDSFGHEHGLFLRSRIERGHRVDASSLESVRGSDQSSAWRPSEPWHVHGGFALRDLEAGRRIEWNDIAAVWEPLARQGNEEVSSE